MKTFFHRYKSEIMSGTIILPLGGILLWFLSSLPFTVFDYGFWLVTVVLLLASLVLASILYISATK